MKIADLFASLRIDINKRSVKLANKALANTGEQLKRLAVGAGAAATAMGFMVAQTARAATRFRALEGEVGVASESMQQLGFAAEVMGIELDNVVDFIGDLNEKAVEAAEGNEDLQKAFKSLGFEVKDANGNLKDAETLATDMADAFAALEDGPKKTQLAMQLFSDEGRKMIPLLNLGSAGIEELRKEFVELGAQISTEDTKALEEYNRTVVRVKTALIGFRNQAVVALLPHLRMIAKQVLAWVKANKALLKQRLLTFMGAVVKLMIVFAKAVVFVLKHIKLLTIAFVSWKAAILAVVVAQKIMAAGGVVAAAKMAAAWALASLPLVLIALLIGAIILIFEDLIGAFTGKKSVLGAIFQEIVKAWGEPVFDFFNKVEKRFKKLELIADDFISALTGRESKRERANRLRSKRLQESLGEESRLKRLSTKQDQEDREQLRRELADPNFGLLFGPPEPPTTQLRLEDFARAGAAAQRESGLAAPALAPEAPITTNNIDITINGSGDPVATGRVVRDELARELQRK